MKNYAVIDLEKLNDTAVNVILARYEQSRTSVDRALTMIEDNECGTKLRAMIEEDMPRRISLDTALSALVLDLHKTLCPNPTKWAEEDMRASIARLKDAKEIIGPERLEKAIDTCIAAGGWTRNELGECHESN